MTQLILTLLAVVKAIQCACYSTPLTATTIKTSKSHYPISNYEDCTFTIKPASYYSGNYYLEITWSTFGVDGDMPNCYGGDYVEVYLTRYIFVFIYAGNKSKLGSERHRESLHHQASVIVHCISQAKNGNLENG